MADKNTDRIMPFIFYSRLTQVEMLGLSACCVRQLAEYIAKVPLESIYHHTHRYLEQHRYFSPEHPNDFSYWITNSLGLKSLGERIASIDIMRFRTLEDLRAEFVAILREYTENTRRQRVCLRGEEFHFLSSRIFIFPTGCTAKDLKGFVRCLRKVSIHSVYFHTFEARLRLQREDNDFSRWFKDNGFLRLADAFSRLDPYTFTLEGLRKKMITLVENEQDQSA